MTLIYQPFMNSYYSLTKDTYAGNHICQSRNDLSEFCSDESCNHLLYQN